MYLNTEQAQGSSAIIGNIVEERSVNLIIIDNSFDSEQRIVSAMRSAGFTARPLRVEDEEDLIEAINSQPPDLVIYFNGIEDFSLQQVCHCLGGTPASKLSRVIAVDKNSTSSIIEALQTGAVDLVSFSNIEHLLLVISREYKALIDARKIETMQESLQQTECRCNSLLDSSRDAIAYIHEGMHVYSNQSYLELFGITASDELEGLPILDVISKYQRETFKEFLRDYVKNKTDIQALQTQLLKPNGEAFEGEMELSPAYIDNEPCIQIIIRKENANIEELEKQLKLLSQKDQLTGIFNRQYFIETLEEVIASCEKSEITAVMMEIQLDNFDKIRDTLGIADADNYIIAAAEILNKNIGEKDFLARYNHSSFGYISHNCDKINAKKLAKKFHKIISNLIFNIKDNSINTTCSIGATLIDQDTPEYNSVLVRTEKALLEATEQGGNHCCVHEPEKGELTRQEVDTRFREQLTTALKDDNFILHFQPIISLHGDTKERYEVFIRLKNVADNAEHSDLIMPQEFLPAAERIGMATAIDRWVFYQTINQILNRWKEGYKTQFFLKLSAASIKDNTLIDWLTYQIKEKQLPPNSLSFVVKETVAVTNLKHTKELSLHLKNLQCGFILDDFGSGTNPFQLLQHIHADYVRLDPSLMEDLAKNTHHQEHIKEITSEASKLDKLTIAQHVPDAASLSILWGMGVNFIQGHFLQAPSEGLDYDFTEM